MKLLLVYLLTQILKPQYVNTIFQDIKNKNIIRIVDIEALQNSLKLPETYLSHNCFDFGHQIQEQSKMVIEKQSLTQEKLKIIMERCTNFIFR
jgi:hypothetical protein